MSGDKAAIACLDVAYGPTAAAAACVLFESWDAAAPIEILTTYADGAPMDYEPGAFFRRELPLLTSALAAVEMAITVLVVDGYVWLDDLGKKGLGAHLHDHLGSAPPVIGVAKTRYRGDTWSTEVFRTGSSRPLLVTSVGVPLSEAAKCVRQMHGPHRIPTMLRLADRAARDRLERTGLPPFR